MHLLRRLPVLALALVLCLPALSSCGGGGGNPGQCFGSDEVCGEGRGTQSTAATPVPSTTGTGLPSGNATCSSFSTQAAAQAALAAGNTELDPNGDGIACNEG